MKRYNQEKFFLYSVSISRYDYRRRRRAIHRDRRNVILEQDVHENFQFGDEERLVAMITPIFKHPVKELTNEVLIIHFSIKVEFERLEIAKAEQRSKEQDKREGTNSLVIGDKWAILDYRESR